VLYIVRNRAANTPYTWAEILGEFVEDSNSGHPDFLRRVPSLMSLPIESMLRNILVQLKRANLVDFDEDPATGQIMGRIKVSENWDIIASTLNISLRDIAAMRRYETIIADPKYGRPSDAYPGSDIFVLMPFRPEMTPIYEVHIKRVAKKLGLSIKRADDAFTAHDVMLDVWNDICAARAIVADCTEKNPNVFYEIGLAHVVGKPVLLITQSGDDVPFDLRHVRYMEYAYTPPGMKQLEVHLARTLRDELGLPPVP
jgi:hypothetical protein